MIINSPQIYLASKSPRRKQLLSQINISFESFSVEMDEVFQDNEKPTPEDLCPTEIVVLEILRAVRHADGKLTRTHEEILASIEASSEILSPSVCLD